jgi:hypothetical protein
MVLAVRVILGTDEQDRAVAELLAMMHPERLVPSTM